MDSNYKKTTQLFSALADETRLKILVSLQDAPKTVNDVHMALSKQNITLSAVSHQLTYLANLGVVVYKKHGKQKTFSLSDNFCWCILKDVMKHFKEDK
ncbi:winged helix-turn-helix transcriptional regulator [Candidatus Woesearchaeota archaeon]|nr:winged helix-turn-helix transcriptional regulator [Candidatus Woesearchaeota archaeon]